MVDLVMCPTIAPMGAGTNVQIPTIANARATAAPRLRDRLVCVGLAKASPRNSRRRYLRLFRTPSTCRKKRPRECWRGAPLGCCVDVH
jgi:hypothetical protein